ncbi:MAG: hypothetical protein ACJ790_10790 [Myxococcaceae bacterium]
MSPLPPCGLYKTTQALGTSVPKGRLVYFHNHGSPGAGVYLPSGWSLNRVSFHEHGTPIPDDAWASSLEPLRAEGLYRVKGNFTCCEKNCRTFEPGLLVQLGYNGEAQAILFVPEWTASGLGFPERGSVVDAAPLSELEPLNVAQGSAPAPKPAGGLLH